MTASFQQDVEFLRQHTEVAVLKGGDENFVAVTPFWQGKTMTSTLRGWSGESLGWLNRAFIQRRQVDPCANLHGGEERLWLGPEGGQFSLFFRPGQKFEFANWRCPDLIDRRPFEVVNFNDHEISMAATGQVTNYSGREFDLRLERYVSVLARPNLSEYLKLELKPSWRAVGHESRNTIINTGAGQWESSTGLPCLWLLGMFPPSDSMEIWLPFVAGPAEQLGSIVTSNYFGELNADRLHIDEDRGLIRFRGDGNYRSKLGLSYRRSHNFLASFDARQNLLTIVQFNRPAAYPEGGYANNLWKIQDAPFEGDTVNVYNDGPNESGGILGPFYELETLSPALPLKPAESYCHHHRTIHLWLGDSSPKISGEIISQMIANE